MFSPCDPLQNEVNKLRAELHKKKITSANTSTSTTNSVTQISIFPVNKAPVKNEMGNALGDLLGIKNDEPSIRAVCSDNEKLSREDAKKLNEVINPVYNDNIFSL